MASDEQTRTAPLELAASPAPRDERLEALRAAWKASGTSEEQQRLFQEQAADYVARLLGEADNPPASEPPLLRHPYTCEWCDGEWPSRMAYEDHFDSLTHKNPDHPYKVPPAIDHTEDESHG